MKTIQDILAAAKIDENGKFDKSIVAELQSVIDEIVELKVRDKANDLIREQVDPVIGQTKEELTAEYENKFEEFKDKVVENFSNFCDQVLDDELQIPEHIQEWAAKGQLYAPILETLRAKLAVEDGAVDSQVTELMQESKQEIERLRNELNCTIGENMSYADSQNETSSLIEEARNEIIKLRAVNYIHEKYGHLSSVKRNRIIALIPENVKLEGEDRLREEVDFIIKNILENSESMGNDKPLGQEKTPIQAELEKKCVCPSCGKIVDVADSNVACSTIKCPDCADTYLTTCDACDEKKNLGLPHTHSHELNEKYVSKAAALYAQLID